MMTPLHIPETYFAVTPGDEEVVSVTRGTIPRPFNIQILNKSITNTLTIFPNSDLEVLCEVSLVGEGEGAGLKFLVELSPAEAVFLVNADCVVQVIQLPGVS